MMSQYKKLLSVAIISFAVPLTVFFVFVGIKYFSGAASQPATVSFSQNPLTVNATTASAENIIFNAGTNKVGFARIQFTFDKTKIQLASEIVPTTTLKTVIFKTPMATANSTGSVTLILGLASADAAAAPTGSFTLAQMSFKAVTGATGSTTLTLTPVGVQVVDMTATAFTLTLTNATVNVATATATPTATPTTGPTSSPISCSQGYTDSFNSLDLTKWSVVSGNPTIANGALQMAEQNVTTNTLTQLSSVNAISGDFSAIVDMTSLTLTPAVDEGTSEIYFETPAADHIHITHRMGANGLNIIETDAHHSDGVSLGKQTSTLIGNTSLTVKIERIGSTITASYKTGTGVYTILGAFSNFTSANGNIKLVSWSFTNHPSVVALMDNFTLGCLTVPTATPTPSPTPTTASLSFHVKFQGIPTAVSPDKQVLVSFKNGTTTVYSTNVTVTPDNNSGAGVYSGTATGITPGIYDIYIKEATHLQRKFTGSTTGITLAAGSNSADFSANSFIAGDFNNDNKITILDIGQILSQYTALSVPVTASNKIYDVNGDGTINISDVALVLSNYTQLEVLGD